MVKATAPGLKSFPQLHQAQKEGRNEPKNPKKMAKMNEWGSENEQIRRWEGRRSEAESLQVDHSLGTIRWQSYPFTGCKVYALRSETRMRKEERQRGAFTVFLDSPGSASLLLQLQGYFHIYTQLPSVIFLPDLLWNPLFLLDQLKSLHFTLEVKIVMARKSELQAVTLPDLTCLGPPVVVATHISSCWSLVLCCWLLPDLVNEGPRWSGLQTNAAGETGGMWPTPCSEGPVNK